MTDLDTRLLTAHEAGDRTRLIALYLEASACAEDDTAAAFYLTHAYVFALEAGDPRTAELKSRLEAAGRL